MDDVNELLSVVFSGLSPLVIENVVDEGGQIVVRATTPQGMVVCPGCGAATERVHSYHERTIADVPVDARRVVIRARVRRLVCPTRGCRQTFREQVPGVFDRYQRRTSRLAAQIGAVVKELAGRAGARLLSALAVALSRHTALRALLRLAVPVRAVPRVLGVDDFALRRGRSYATILIDVETHERVDVLPDRKADTLEAWLRAHSGVQIVCRDGSGSHAEAIRRALPAAVQVGDRWHLWHNLAEAVHKDIAAHSTCWAKAGPPLREGARAQTTRQRWQQVHALLDKGVGLLECARRLNLSLNTVKRYARFSEPERLVRAPQYRPTLVDPHRDHLRMRREQDPAIPVTHLFDEIKKLGYRQSQPAPPLHHPGPRRGRPLHPLTQARHRPSTDPPRRPRRRPTRTSRQLRLRLPRDDRPRRPGKQLRRTAHPGPNQQRSPDHLDRHRTDRGPAPPALLHPRTRPRPRRRQRRPHHRLPQRHHRRRQHEDQADQTADVRTRKLPAPTTPHPSRLTSPTVTTESATEPDWLCDRPIRTN